MVDGDCFMKNPLDSLIDEVLRFDVARAAMIDPSGIDYSSDFRRLCEENKCGHYGTNWMCPPLVGPYDACKARAGRYQIGLVFQTVHPMPNSRDWKGIRNSFNAHDRALKKVMKHLKEVYGVEDILALGAGPCTYCEKCASVEGEKCPFPDEAVPSLESHGIDVGALVHSCDIPYHNEKGTISLVGCVFFKPKET